MIESPPQHSAPDRSDPGAPAAPWRQVPPPLVDAPSIVLPWAVATFPAWVLVGRMYVDDGQRRITLLVVSAVVALALKRWPRAAVPLVVAGSLCFLPTYTGAQALRVAPFALTALVLVCIGTGAVRCPWPRVTESVRHLAMAPLVPAALWCLLATGFVVPDVLVGSALGVVLAGPVRADAVASLVERIRRVADPTHRGVTRFVAVLGRAVGAIVALPALLLACLVWLFQRAVRFDPLARDPGWRLRPGGDAAPHRLFSESRARAVPRPARVSWLRVAVVVACGVAVVAGSLWLGERAQDATCRAPGDDPAVGSDPGWPETWCEINDFASHGRFDPVTTYVMDDFASTHTNVVDGQRSTWQPPACGDCRRISLWVLGGSSAFGWWQRDDYTMPSQLAKVAWRHGIALDISLHAMPGWVLGQEVRLFGDLSTRREPPDLALFYDGGNDLNLQKDRDEIGRGADESAVSFSEEELDRLLSEGPFPWVVQDVDPPARDSGPKLDPEIVADHAMDRYLADKELAERLADAAGTEAVFVWQPLLPSAPRAAGAPGAIEPGDRAWWAEGLPAARRRLPDDVIDLGDSLDDVDQPVFKDTWHTNERASRIVAEALFDEIEPLLDRLSG